MVPKCIFIIHLYSIMYPQSTTTNCLAQPVEFSKIGKRKIVAEFNGGHMSSNAGALALREVEERCQLLGRMADCFSDYRDPSRVKHSLKRLLGQPTFGLCVGYEDLNDHDRLRDDPILCLALGCEDIEGDERVRDRDKGHALASSKTLNRLELSVEETAAKDRYKRMAANMKKLHELLTESFWKAMRSHRSVSFWIWTPRIMCCMAIRREGFITGTMVITAICRCTSRAESMS